MNSPDIAKIFSEDWPSLVGVVAAAAIHFLLIRRPPSVDRVRRQLRGALNRFAGVPAAQLDSALVAAAQATQRDWRGIVLFLCTMFCVAAAFFSFLLFRACFPELPRWLGYLVCGLVAGVLAWPIQRLERRSILHRLEQASRCDQKRLTMRCSELRRSC